MEVLTLRRFMQLSRLILIPAVGIGGVVVLMLVSIGVLNSELYGRLTETQTFALPSPTTSDDGPLARLVIHRIVPDENAVEASLILVVAAASELGEEIRTTGTSVKAEVHDASYQQLFELSVHTPSIDAATFVPGSTSAVVRSDRFLLSTYPSLGTYPFDDHYLRPLVMVSTARGAFLLSKLEVQKALPGRLLSVSSDSGIPVVALKRAPTEKAFILAASFVFVLVSVAVTAGLFFSPKVASSFDQLVAIAGYLLAAAGFRELLGVSRVAGTTVLEIVILGLPLVLLSFGVAYSLYRTYREQTA